MEIILLGVDSLLVSALYYFYQKNAKKLLNIENCPELDSLLKLETDKKIEYGMITGKVKPNDLDYCLISNYNNNLKGVIRQIEIKEHGTSFKNKVTVDTSRVITSVVDDVSFHLLNDKSKLNKFKVLVERPLKADYIMDSLEITYKKFEPSNEPFYSKFISYLASSETVRGVEVTEKMLKNDTMISVYGKIEKVDSIIPQVKISEPTLKNCSYIITKMDRKTLIENVKTNNKIIKVCLYIFGGIGIGVGAYFLYDYLKKYFEEKKRSNQIKNLKLQNLKIKKQRNERKAKNNTDDQNSSCCVICLVNPRELVLIECGHVCLCIECLEKMPNKNCPICRQEYKSFVPCYLP